MPQTTFLIRVHVVLIYPLKSMLMLRTQWSNAFKVLSENDLQPGLPNPAKLPINHEETDEIIDVFDLGRKYSTRAFKNYFREFWKN